jgi:hypothetical protein
MGVGSWIAEREQNAFCAVVPLAVEFLESGPQSVDAEVSLAVCSLEAIQECGQVDELAARVHEIKVEHLLACHK